MWGFSGYLEMLVVEDPLLWWVYAGAVMVVLHELCHLLIARLLGAKIRSVVSKLGLHILIELELKEDSLMHVLLITLSPQVISVALLANYLATYDPAYIFLLTAHLAASIYDFRSAYTAIRESRHSSTEATQVQS